MKPETGRGRPVLKWAIAFLFLFSDDGMAEWNMIDWVGEGIEKRQLRRSI